MSSELQTLKRNIEQWATDAHESGLLNKEAMQAIEDLGTATPASLFDVGERPLVVGLFGGTGVGKSTLLNRLAGDSIARTGVERPTSREVTMYLHSSVTVSQLPDAFPVDKIRVSSHNREEHRHMLWIDMPDFDSVEEENRLLVQGWLPHIDLLVYVVSPERYKDDNGWRLLLANGHRHAWVFVINHWDRGNELQRQDFSMLLSKAGLKNPELFVTDCSQQDKGALTEVLSADDEFDALQTTILSMADANTIHQLEARGVTVRAGEMQQHVEQAIGSMGNPDNFSRLLIDWESRWDTESTGVQQSVQWRFPLMARRYEQKDPGIIRSIVQVIRRQEPEPDANSSMELVDDGQIFDQESILRVTDDIDALPQLALDHQLPPALIRRELEPIRAELGRDLNRTATQSLKQSLLFPGNRLQRATYKLLGFLGAVLPLLAMCWVGYRIVEGFYRGAQEPNSYLGGNFAINGLLLIGLSWLVPWFLRRKTRPSLGTAALKGMQTGSANALTQVNADIKEALNRARENQIRLITKGQQFLPSTHTTERQEGLSRDLERVLIDRH